MTLAFFEFTAPELILLALVFLIPTFLLANYGKSTALGFWGTFLLAILTTPLTALIIVLILRSRQRDRSTY